MSYPKLTPIIAKDTTEPRYLEDRFTDVVNVKDFGAKGDGITDDTTALTSAFAISGKVSLEKNKTYLISSALFVSGNHLVLNMNGSTIKATGSATVVLAPYDTDATGYSGLSDIHISDGTFLGVGFGFAHNKNCSLKNIKFKNTNGSHHIQVFASSDIHIENCYFEGLYSTADSPHYESINIDPGDATAFPLFPADSVTYDGTKNANIFIDSCHWECGSGDYAHLDATVGTHYDDGDNQLHDCIFITNCVMKGVGQWGVRANSWKNSVVSNCFIETIKFAFDCGYQKRAENIAFINSIIVKNFTTDSDNPIHLGPFRVDNINITNIKCINSADTVEEVSNLLLGANLDPAATAETYKGSRCTDILPLRNGYFQVGKMGYHWASGCFGDVYLEKANPYLKFNETDVEKNVAPSSTGFQGIYFQDKNQAVFGSIIFQTQKSGSSPYNTISISHAGNLGTDTWHSVMFREDASSNWGFFPDPSNTVSLGKSGNIWKDVYANNASIQTSDQSLKDNIAAPSEALMRAWGKVSIKVFQFKNALQEKGENARIHVGVIAQEVAEAFSSEGLDAARYGLFCYDEWPDEFEDRKVVDVEAVLDKNGNVVEPEQSHVEHVLVHEGGSQYGIRYGEALALECAYQRWRLEQLEEHINQLTNSNK